MKNWKRRGLWKKKRKRNWRSFFADIEREISLLEGIMDDEEESE